MCFNPYLNCSNGETILPFIKKAWTDCRNLSYKGLIVKAELQVIFNFSFVIYIHTVF